jgi:probable addiction module antidote protein
MGIKTKRWDSAENLETEEDIQLYLDACIEEAGDDPAFIVHALSVIARAKNMSQLARDTGLTRKGLHKA